MFKSRPLQTTESVSHVFRWGSSSVPARSLQALREVKGSTNATL